MCVTCSGGYAYALSKGVDSILNVLDHEIAASKSEYQLRKENVLVNSMKACEEAADDTVKFKACSDLFRDYLNFQSDSAYMYARRMENLSDKASDPKWRALAQSALITCYARTGFFNEGMEIIESIDAALLPTDERMDYYYNAASMLGKMEDMVGPGSDLSEKYRQRRSAFYDSIIEKTAPKSFRHINAVLRKHDMMHEDDSATVLLCHRILANYEP